MGAGEFIRSGSVRMGSRSFWGEGDGAFSKSEKDEDDEDALQWATLERLPTFARVRKGLLDDGGEKKEVDIKNLSAQAKKELLDRLVKATEEGNEGFLLKLKDRISR